MINRLRRAQTGVGVPTGNADNVGIVVDVNGQIVVDYGTGGQKLIPQVPLSAANAIKVLTASAPLTAADAGKTIVFDSTTSIIASLPSAAACKGCSFRFFWKQLTAASTGHGVSPAAADGVGGGVTALTTVVNKDVYSAQATDTVNDRLTIVSTGAAGTGAWIVTDANGVFTKEA